MQMKYCLFSIGPFEVIRFIRSGRSALVAARPTQTAPLEAPNLTVALLPKITHVDLGYDQNVACCDGLFRKKSKPATALSDDFSLRALAANDTTKVALRLVSLQVTSSCPDMLLVSHNVQQRSHEHVGCYVSVVPVLSTSSALGG